MARVERWIADDGWLRRPGRAGRLLDDGFVVGTTRPVWRGSGDAANNVGCLLGVARSTVESVTQAEGAVHANLTITGKVNISAANQTFFNCRFTYASTGSATGGLAQNSTTADYPVTFERCEFEPSSCWDRYNGYYGHHVTMLRCAITRTVDGLGLYNPTGGPVAAVVRGCWIGHLAWYDDDYFVDPTGTTFPSGRPNGHSDGSGTHNDGLQQGSGQNVEVTGCFFQGARYNALNPGNITLDPDGLTYSVAAGNGITPLSDTDPTYGYPQQSNIHLGKADAYGPVTNIAFCRNWIWNAGHGISLQIGGSQGGTALVATVEDNIFGGRWRDYGGTSRYYPIRYTVGCTVNGHAPSAAGSQTDTAGNVWAADVHESMTISGVSVAGQPVLCRYDA